MECQRLHMSFLSPHRTPTSNPTRPDVLNYAPKHSNKTTYDSPAPPMATKSFQANTKVLESIQKLTLNHNFVNKLLRTVWMMRRGFICWWYECAGVAYNAAEVKALSEYTADAWHIAVHSVALKSSCSRPWHYKHTLSLTHIHNAALGSHILYRGALSVRYHVAMFWLAVNWPIILTHYC